LKIRDEFEPIVLPKLVVDTGRGMEEAIAAAREYLKSKLIKTKEGLAADER
jgi:hypothetical protein